MRGFGKYWGWVVFAVLLAGWLTFDFGSVVLLVLSGVGASYFFFNVPVWCGAEGRGGSCRNNSSGALMGRHLRQHKWQKLEDAVLECPMGTTPTGAVSERDRHWPAWVAYSPSHQA